MTFFQNNCFLLVISILFMLRFACIGFLGLMNPIEGMETWAEQLLLCLSPTLVHRFDGIEVGTVDDLAFVLFHTSTVRGFTLSKLVFLLVYIGLADVDVSVSSCRSECKRIQWQECLFPVAQRHSHIPRHHNNP